MRPGQFDPTDGILILRLGAVGDVIRTLPALAALRKAFPHARIGWIVEPGSMTLLPGKPWIDDVFVFPRTALSARTLSRRPLRSLQHLNSLVSLTRKFEPAVSLDFQGSAKSSLLARLSTSPCRIGYSRDASREGSSLLNNCLVTPSEARLNRIWKNLELLAPLGISDRSVEFPFPARQASGKVSDLLRSLARSTVVAVHPGTSHRQSHKRWPEDRFAMLVLRLRDLGLFPILTWGPGEEDMVRRILEKASGGGMVAPPLSLLEMREFLAGCRCFVGGDTGPMHLAWAQRIPVVALFGSTDPVVNGPLGPEHRILAPAWRAGHPVPSRGDATAMQEISVEDVVRSVLEVAVLHSAHPSQACPC